MTDPLHIPFHSALFTDLYELTMARAYLHEKMGATAVFQLFFRDLPEKRNYVVAYGVEDAVRAVETFRFTEDDLEYLSSLDEFDRPFLDALRELRFTGTVRAVRDGSVVFPYEPLIEVSAPIVEAQVLETALLNRVHVGCVLASKAARVASAAGDRPVVDFGSRRAHGVDAALVAARAGYVAGLTGTSSLLAGRLYGIPVFGTMAHSYVQAHGSEPDAMRRFSELFPGTTLLVDTYDTPRGTREVVRLARVMGRDFTVRAIRIDSGDLAALAKEARTILDEGGLEGVTIFVSGGLDEYAIRDLIDRDAPVDGFGVGTKMVVSEDAPDLDLAYKLVEYDGRPRTKTSPGKPIFPGRKQVWRRERNGVFVGDRIVLEGVVEDGEPLLRPVMRDGRRVDGACEGIEAARAHCRNELARLPSELKSLETAASPYPVEISETIRETRSELEDRLA